MDKKERRNKILKVSGLVALFLVVFGLSYALFTVTLNGTRKVKLKTAKLELQLLDKNNNPIYSTSNNVETSYEINLDNQVPVDDETGLGTQAFEFKLKNTGNLKANYTIYLDDVALESGEERMDDQYIRYSLTKNGSEDSAQALSSRKLDEGVIDTDNTTYTYTLKIWIAENATNEAMDKVFNATLRVEGTQYVAPAASEYGVEIASTQLSETITATYYQPEGTSYNTSDVKRMSNVQKIDNEERYEGGTLVISGSGDMIDNYSTLLFLGDVSTPEDFENLYDEDLGKYLLKYNPTNLIVEEGITSISDSSFSSVASIINVVLPSTLTSIGDYAFSLTSIIELRLPLGLKSLGEGAFYDIKSLHTLYIPSSVEAIAYNVFGSETKNAIIYCESQDVGVLASNSLQPNSTIQVIVDPTKFE